MYDLLRLTYNDNVSIISKMNTREKIIMSIYYACDHEKYTLLHHIIDHFIKYPIDGEYCEDNYYIKKGLKYVCKHGDLISVSQLVHCGKTKYKDNYNIALTYACQYRKYKIVKQMIAFGALRCEHCCLWRDNHL